MRIRRSPGSPSMCGSPSAVNRCSWPSFIPCSISTSKTLSSFTSLQHEINRKMSFFFYIALSIDGYCWILDIENSNYLTLGHSSQMVCCVIWNLPGPSCRVTISCLQLHLRVPLAGFNTGLLWVIWSTTNVLFITGKWTFCLVFFFSY